MPFDLQAPLQGELIELRPLTPGDFEALYAAASDPLIWELHPERNRFERTVFEGFFKTALESKGAYAILDRATGEIIGSSRYYDYQPELSQVCIGFTFLKRSHWGGTTNRELKSLMLTHAFRFVKTVLFHVGEGNLRSRRAVEKLGAKLSHQKDTTVVYALTASSN